MSSYPGSSDSCTKEHAVAGSPTKRPSLAVLGLFLLLAGALNPSLALHPGRFFVPPGGDFAHEYWNFWWTAQALSHGQDPLHTTLIFHPGGVSLLWRAIPILVTAAAAPLVWACGTAVAYNLSYLVTFVLAGWCAYLLGRYVTRSELGGIAAGAAFAFAPPHFLLYSSQTYAHYYWLPLVVLAFLRLRDTGRLRHGILAGVWTGGSLLTSPYFAVYSALTALLLGAGYLVFPRGRKASTAAWLRGLAAWAATALAVSSPLVVPMVLEALRGVPVAVEPRGAADLLGLKNRLAEGAPSELIGWPALFGYVLVLGALLGAIRGQGGRARIWVGLAAFFLFLAMGTTLTLAGHPFPAVPTPADLLGRLPLFSSMRGYKRALVMVLLCLSLLFARFVARLAASRGRKGRGLAWGLVALLLLEFRPPPLTPVPDPVPPFYRELAASPREGAVLVIPFDNAVDSRGMLRPMFMQTVHGKPLIGGHASRPDPALRERMKASPFLSRFLAEDPERPLHPFPVPGPGTAAALREDLISLGVRTVILQREYLNDGNPSESTSSREDKGPLLEAGIFLPPLWWGRAAGILRGLEHRDPLRLSRPPARRSLDPSVIPFLQAVLGEPSRTLADGALAWVL